MILSKKMIQSELAAGNIRIEPFDDAHLNTNGYDFHLGDTFMKLPDGIIDVRTYNGEAEKIVIASGEPFLAEPHCLYLGVTMETFSSDQYAQFLYGDRSIGSLGVWVNISAPLGHVGSSIRWTLEITVVKPVILYPGMKFGRVAFFANQGMIHPYGSAHFHHSGKYLQNDIQTSRKAQDPPL